MIYLRIDIGTFEPKKEKCIYPKIEVLGLRLPHLRAKIGGVQYKVINAGKKFRTKWPKAELQFNR